jgi:hypothetical protein
VFDHPEVVEARQRFMELAQGSPAFEHYELDDLRIPNPTPA